MSDLHTLAFEIGTEEIPAFDLHQAASQLESLMRTALDGACVVHGALSVHTTPRRLIVVVRDVADTTRALEEVFRGPSAKIAFDDKGNPTKAALGFARRYNITPEQLLCREENGVDYVFASRRTPARDIMELLPDILKGIIEHISWSKSCRWGTTSDYFSRPVRWLLALLDKRIIPVEFAGLMGGNITYGHRFLAPGPHKVTTASDLLEVLENAFVVTSASARKDMICKGVARIEERTGARAVLPEKTLLEVINLCEQPSVLVGTFDEEFLRVPEEIIVDAMLMHQRYFPLYDAQGNLTNNFIIVSNGNPACACSIARGNERVVRARLADAKFFYEEDLKHPLEAYVNRLDEVVFQETLGTMKDKTGRVVELTEHLSCDAGLCEADRRDANRAAYLAKADLVTNAVVEFTSVQGIMGSYYAKASHENCRVARAIADHYRPRFAGDALPESDVGRVVALADKLDTICGLFAVGQGPSGSSDPFALRRSAIGILAMLEAGLSVSLVDATDASLATYATTLDFDCDAVRNRVIDFFITRTKVMLRDSGCSPDAVDAVLAAGVKEPADIIARVRALVAARNDAPQAFDDLATAFARAHNLCDTALGVDVDTAYLCDAERALLEATDKTAAYVEEAFVHDDYAQALAALASLRYPIDRFFEDVLVMDKDKDVRTNRLRLLNRFVAVFAHVADFGKMVKSAK